MELDFKLSASRSSFEVQEILESVEVFGSVADNQHHKLTNEKVRAVDDFSSGHQPLGASKGVHDPFIRPSSLVFVTTPAIYTATIHRIASCW